MNVAIVGFGIEGRSALNYYLRRDANVTICDQNETTEIPEGVASQLGAGYLDNLDCFDVIVRTVGMHPKVILERNPTVKDKITTNINEFFRACPTKNVIAVTGTKGKGTTSMLTVKMLEATGKKVFIGGNFGIPALDFLPEITPDDWVVMELSSYMLYDFTHSPHVGICLMTQPEHIDWHGDTDDYYRSKSNLFAGQSQEDIAVYFGPSASSKEIASHGAGRKIPYFQQPGAYVKDDKIMIDEVALADVTELQLPGAHNWQNVCAATTAVWQVAPDAAAIHKVLTTFTGLPHRIEPVRTIDGVTFYNDSFSSDPYAAEAAVRAISAMKVLILGGYDRMLPLESLAQTLKEAASTIRTLVLIGASAERLANVLEQSGVTNYHLSKAQTMPEIVNEARSYAQPGDSVVFTPGFPSYDMFKNFEVRGMLFKQTVDAL